MSETGVNMHIYQRGILPIIFRISGIAALSASVLTFVVWFPHVLIHENVPPNSDPLAVLIVFIPCFLFTGFLLLSVFPPVQLLPTGFAYRLLFFYTVVEWSDIVLVEELRNGIICVSIRPRSFFHRYRFFFQHFVGSYMRRTYPVVLLSPGIQNYERVIDEIISYSHAKHARHSLDN